MKKNKIKPTSAKAVLSVVPERRPVSCGGKD